MEVERTNSMEGLVGLEGRWRSWRTRVVQIVWKYIGIRILYLIIAILRGWSINRYWEIRLRTSIKII